MRKSKNQRDIESIEALKERFYHLSSELIASRLIKFSKSNNISIAYKQILKDRGINDYLIFLTASKD